ncbi:MAG: Glu/Leu/Phe/Val dehydrogenase dimerization domain-containing protein [Nannocystaceae bacterium]
MDRVDVPGFDQVMRLRCGGATAYLALHRVLHGRAFGGIRIRTYPREEDALADALALAEAMSRKCALAEIPGGGAKTVLCEPAPARREEALRELAAVIDGLGGRYLCGGDYGFTVDDQRIVAAGTRHIACGDGDDATAAGVQRAMSAIQDVRVVAIQGLGRVGARLAARLVDAGLTVIAADPRDDAARDLPIERVSIDAIASVPCDVFAPCAHGGTIDAATIDRLRARAICGAANNPLATEADARRLVERGIDLVPDFLANAGALIHGASRAVGEADRIEARMERIPALTREILDRARAEARSPQAIARSIADARIAARVAEEARP